ncbi:MAG: exo-alpha-sialidase [Clostridia bacterium]|nr:exo-alpha-sialidase [Clostridia bacterium]
MKKIGKEVLFLHTKEGNPRNGEGTFARLKDGRILHLYTEYYGTEWQDDAIAHLCACYSSDEGETWTEPTVLIEKEPSYENIMSPGLVRLKNGELGLTYLVKEKVKGTAITCMPVFRSSADEGASWTEPVKCCVVPGYYCAINDGAIVEPDGRILIPMGLHGPYYDPAAAGHRQPRYSGKVVIACSYDNGKTWGMIPHVFYSPFADTSGLAEPGVYAHEDGELWMWCRSAYGHQYQSFSKDGGMTWSPVTPNLFFTSPDSPMRIKRVGDYTVAVFNPLPYNCLRTDHSVRGNTKRTPLACAVSRDDGHSLHAKGVTAASGALVPMNPCVRLLEDDYSDSYCYPSMIEVEGGFLVAYYHSDGSDHTLNSTKIIKVRFDELGM